MSGISRRVYSGEELRIWTMVSGDSVEFRVGFLGTSTLVYRFLEVREVLHDIAEYVNCLEILESMQGRSGRAGIVVAL